MTNFVHRILLVVPTAKVAAVASWLNANIDPACVPADLGPGLNASGLAADPASHRWACAASGDADCKAILAKLCQLSGVTPPTNAQWNGWTGPQKRSWLLSVQSAMRTNYGVWVVLMDNTGQWDDPSAALAAMSLQTIAPA